MQGTMLLISLLVLGCLSVAFAANMDLVILSTFPNDSACLDGSPYGYYFRAGSSSNKWIIHHQGGGWCYTLEDCAVRATTALGSSTSWTNVSASWGGLLDDDPTINPNFNTWNVVALLYCDGSSFSGFRGDPLPYGGKNIYFRGKNNLIAATLDLQAKGLNQATDVIITGCSAGGLATYLHLDYWASMVPTTATIRGIPDAGFFLDTTSFYGPSVYTPQMQGGFTLWNSTNGVNADCIENYLSTNETWKCIFAQYTYPFIKTPLFALNSKYDSWQIPFIYALPCYSNLTKCNATEIQDFLQYGNTFLTAFSEVEQNPNSGLFIDACYTHCQSLGNTWTRIFAVTEDGTKVTPNAAFYNWYYGKSETRAVDTCAFPCNPTC